MAASCLDTSQHKFNQPSEFNIDENDSYDARCGEIFITLGRILIFHCSFCDSKYGHFDYFLEHLLEHYEECEVDLGDPAHKSSENEIREELINCDSSDKTEEDYLVALNEIDREGVGPLDESLHEYNELQCKEKIKAIEKTPSERDESAEYLRVPLGGYRKPIRKNFVLQANSSKNRQSNRSGKKRKRPQTVLESGEEKCESTKEKGVFKCAICNKAFKSKCYLSYHSVVHSSERKHKCEICGFAFKDRSNLIAHIRRCHTGQKDIGCEFCSKMFFTRTEAETHMRTHTGEKPYVCSYCGLAFQTSSKMTMHAKRHTETAPFKCSYCFKEFWHKKDMLDHILVHTKEKPFSCPICSARFPRRKSMLRHTKLHEK